MMRSDQYVLPCDTNPPANETFVKGGARSRTPRHVPTGLVPVEARFHRDKLEGVQYNFGR